MKKVIILICALLAAVALAVVLLVGTTTEIKRDIVFSELVGEIDFENLDNNVSLSQNTVSVNLNISVRKNIFGIISCEGTVTVGEEYQVNAFAKSVGETYILVIGNNNRPFANIIANSALDRFLYIPLDETGVYTNA